jgi:hypothetical protein
MRWSAANHMDFPVRGANPPYVAFEPSLAEMACVSLRVCAISVFHNLLTKGGTGARGGQWATRGHGILLSCPATPAAAASPPTSSPGLATAGRAELPHPALLPLQPRARHCRPS